MNHPVARFLPSIALVLTTLAGALPWSALAGATGSTTSAGVMLPLAVIHGCGLWRGASLPAGVVFLAGLLADVLTAGPLGYWPLIYLLGLIVVRFCVSRTQVELPNILAGWLSCTVSVMLLGFAAWAMFNNRGLSDRRASFGGRGSLGRRWSIFTERHERVGSHVFAR
jgi:rod shape-determining protein MreD